MKKLFFVFFITMSCATNTNPLPQSEISAIAAYCKIFSALLKDDFLPFCLPCCFSIPKTEQQHNQTKNAGAGLPRAQATIVKSSKTQEQEMLERALYLKTLQQITN